MRPARITAIRETSTSLAHAGFGEPHHPTTLACRPSPTHRASPLQRRTRRDDLIERRARVAAKIRTMADTAQTARTKTHLRGLQTFP